MTPTEAFQRARDVLLDNAGDLERARAQFRWPELADFNWAHDWFDVQARGNHGAAIKLVADSQDTSRVITHSFAEMSERSARLARWLSDHGVQRGECILVMLPNVLPLWDTMLASIKLGAVIIPATTQLTASDLEDRLERGAVRHIVTDSARAANLRAPERLGVRLAVGGAPGFVDFEAALDAPASFARVATRATDPLLLYFTSGTTSKPKLVLHTQQSYPVGHLSTMFWLGVKPGDVHQNVSSPGWAKHAWSSFFAPWNAGATVLMHDTPRFSARRQLEVLREHRVNTLCAPPTVWRMVVLEDLGARPASLRELASAGEPLNAEVIDAVRKAWGLTIRDGFGQTETTAQIGNPPGFIVRDGSMGKPLPGYDVVMLDKDGNETDEGEIALRLSPRPVGLMHGYIDGGSPAAMAGGYYRTGDEARRDDDGYIHFVGRGDDVFKSSDYRISPFELESVMLECELVAEAAVVPSPDPLRFTVPKAFVVLKPGVAATREAARTVFAACNRNLAPYKRVRRLEFAELPKTISGKIRRVELRKLEAARREKDQRGAQEYWLDEL
jgi:acetyl-CoA synthetase